jgi:tRNA-dihydrouridine synthase B
MLIGNIPIPNRVIVAPMAGVTDRPFRQMCKRLGAGMAVSEMVASNSQLWHTDKTVRRGNHEGETEPKVIQIAGADPLMMAEAARYNVGRGAQIIDINMGCPAKKVCNVAAGSALMQNEDLVARILDAVVNAVNVPVTLKTRTGWHPEHKNAVRIAQLAEAAGIAAITIHGRTRACQYNGHAEYDTVRAVKRAVRIPVIANGDIDSPAKAKAVLAISGADAIMIGRAAQGRPWIFREVVHELAYDTPLAPPRLDEIGDICRNHLIDLYAFYGEFLGVRIARKHIGWYLRDIPQVTTLRARINSLESSAEQFAAVDATFTALALSESDEMFSDEVRLAA